MAWTDLLSDYVDIDFVSWLIWLFTPLLVQLPCFASFRLLVRCRSSCCASAAAASFPYNKCLPMLFIKIISFLHYQIAFLLPFIIILLIYMSALIIFIYRHRHKLDLTKIVDEIERKHYWSGALHAIAGNVRDGLFTSLLYVHAISRRTDN